MINPLQAKHLPVSPTASSEMMDALARKISAGTKRAKLVIAFAETATAVGAAVAAALGENCAYIATTREIYSDGAWLDFAEEHSHAVTQLLCLDRLPAYLAATDEVVFVDDEFSTGQTLLNIVQKLRQNHEAWHEKKIIAASLINRLTAENEARWQNAGISAESLIKLPWEEYRPTEAVTSPSAPTGEPLPRQMIEAETKLKNPRRGVIFGEYSRACENLAVEIADKLKDELSAAEKILTLGTEECMYPAIKLGQLIEKRCPAARVFCHATTRSPIGIGQSDGYPIRNGFALPGLYEADRRTFVYNLDAYDLAVVVSDAPDFSVEGQTALARAFGQSGCGSIVFTAVKNV